MLYAIPTANGQLCPHFGHCQQFALVETENNEIIKTTFVTPPPHEPGLLPVWLHDKGVNFIIAGGMGQRAQQIFAQNSIQVICGAPADKPENLVKAHLRQTLVSGPNTCDH
ncbi:MAG: ATPase [Candidatus Cloacimonadota bacterium]|nr:MAG: ATPase [Candidatus Cloacimonadota bacterium]